MAFVNSNEVLRGRIPLKTPAGGEIVAHRFEIALTTGDLALNTTGVLGYLPAGCLPVDVHVDATDLDSGAAAMVLQVGIANTGVTDLSSAAADGGGNWGATVAANTAFHQRIVPTLRNMLSVTKADVDRPLAVKVATAPSTPAAGTLGVTLFYRAA
jgi:hypothetical protein